MLNDENAKISHTCSIIAYKNIKNRAIIMNTMMNSFSYVFKQSSCMQWLAMCKSIFPRALCQYDIGNSKSSD